MSSKDPNELSNPGQKRFNNSESRDSSNPISQQLQLHLFNLQFLQTLHLYIQLKQNLNLFGVIMSETSYLPITLNQQMCFHSGE